MVVHYGGLAVDVETLRAALPKGISIIEDAAHALGARFSNGKPVGSSGNLTCFSFYGNKNLSTGEGGAIALFEDSLAERLQSLRQHGLPIDAWKRFSNPQYLLSGELRELGYKMNYTDLQACIGRVQLRRQPEFHAKRLAIAKRYFAGVESIGLVCQKSCIDIKHARHLFIVLLPLEKMKYSRDEIVVRLREENIGASIHYAPLHQMLLYSNFGSVTVLPNTEYISRRIMTFPISASMDLDDVDDVLEALQKAIV
jgi:dTDP-4-amino-4,6-dideoxygalactose transaminase